MYIKASMGKDIICSVIIPVFNEEKTIENALNSLASQLQIDSNLFLDKRSFEIIIVDNNSNDNTSRVINHFRLSHPDMTISLISEPRQGVAWARKTGMDLAVQRSQERDGLFQITRPFYLLSTDADCSVDSYWIDAQIKRLKQTHAALCVNNYFYSMEHFCLRPNLSNVMNLILHARDYTMRIFGGFPDGKGFAVLREKYIKIGGIEIFYQLNQGKFVCHLSDDWDFGIKIRASGEDIVYCPEAKVCTNPRRVDYALPEMILGKAYGKDGIITMQDIRSFNPVSQGDLTLDEAKLLLDYSIKDFTTKHIILPVLLTPSLLEKQNVKNFLTENLCLKLSQRIHEIKNEMRVMDFTPIHSYKTPCFRLYFEFRNEIFERMRVCIDPKLGLPPSLPRCLKEVLDQDPENYLSYVYYFCEDRESGEAHNYFGNGGVF